MFGGGPKPPPPPGPPANPPTLATSQQSLPTLTPPTSVFGQLGSTLLTTPFDPANIQKKTLLGQ